MKTMKTEEGKRLMKEFETMTEMAELRALSKLSLEKPLNDEQYKRMKALGDKHIYGKVI